MKAYYIGVDLGTSAVKLLLVDGAGAILNSVTKEYPLIFPQPGWCEQEPACWWDACKEGIRQLLQGFDASRVKGIGCGGQMHGLVVLDREDRVIRPAILWNDGRTEKEVEYLNEEIGKEVCMGIRPENIDDSPEFVAAHPESVITVNVEVTELMGSETYLYMSTTGKDDNIIARVDPRTATRAGDKGVKVAFDTTRLHFFDKETEETILTR